VLARGARSHVTLDRGDELRRGLTPARPREVDLAGTPHAVASKERPDRLADILPARDTVETWEERRVVCRPEALDRPGAGPHDVGQVPEGKPHLGRDVPARGLGEVPELGRVPEPSRRERLDEAIR